MKDEQDIECDDILVSSVSEVVLDGVKQAIVTAPLQPSLMTVLDDTPEVFSVSVPYGSVVKVEGPILEASSNGEIGAWDMGGVPKVHVIPTDVAGKFKVTKFGPSVWALFFEMACNPKTGFRVARWVATRTNTPGEQANAAESFSTVRNFLAIRGSLGLLAIEDGLEQRIRRRGCKRVIKVYREMCRVLPADDGIKVGCVAYSNMAMLGR